MSTYSLPTFSSPIFSSSVFRAAQRLRILALLALLSLASGMAMAQNTSYQGLWWVAAESGWGFNITHQGDVVVAAWYTYDTNGKPMWLLLSAAKQADGSFTGDVHRTTGRPFSQINGSPALVSTAKVGTATLRFASATALQLNYTVNGTSQQKSMTRYNFSATPPTCSFTTGSLATATNFTDLWWNPQESGWGVNMTHQDNTIAAAWYTYAADGTPMWLLSTPSLQADGSYSGQIFRASTGTPLLQINGTAALAPGAMQSVGNLVLRFSDGEKGTMSFTLDNVTQSKNIQRYAFSSPRTVCAAANGNPGNPGNPGSASSCYPGYTVGDRRSFRNTAQIATQPQVVDNTSEHVTGTSTYNGHPVFVVESRDALGRTTTKNYTEQTASEFIQWGADTIDPATGLKTGTVTYVPELRTPRNLTVGQTISNTFNTVTSVTVQGFTYNATDRHQHTIKLLGNENVTVPAGTFNNTCKVEVIDTVTPQATGTPITVNAINWTNSTVGAVKTTATTPTTFGLSTSLIELMSASVGGVNVP